MAYQWNDAMEGTSPASMTELPCDCWAVKDGPGEGRASLLCIWCGWYRFIPIEDVAAAQALRQSVDLLQDAEDD